MSRGTQSKVSVVIPAYNAAATIERELNSVYAQTYPNIIEVIVVDDGSTDNTAQIVRRRYPSAVLVQQPNVGEAGARNRGIREANGEYIAFLDADDEWLEKRVKRQMEVLIADENLDFCGCLIEVQTETGRRVRTVKEQPGKTIPVEFRRRLFRKYPAINLRPLGKETP
ncbi:MAG: glycosyltransferase family 2 protein [Candidatus Zipacnadales bacterium]